MPRPNTKDAGGIEEAAEADATAEGEKKNKLIRLKTQMVEEMWEK